MFDSVFGLDAKLESDSDQENESDLDARICAKEK